MDGVVISRQVDAGQTVAASLNTPTLFTIAQDLREMQVEVAIDESDISKIRPAQRVTFTVDAFPGRTFEGKVAQIRKAAQTVQNVVTYTVVVATDNPNLLLVPGMTANVRIVSDSRENVLKVPNARVALPAAGRRRREGRRGGPGGVPGAAAAGRRAGAASAARRRAQARRRAAGAPRRGVRRAARTDGGAARPVRRPTAARAASVCAATIRQKIGAMLNPEQQRRYAEIVAAETGRGSTTSGRVYVIGSADRPVEVACASDSPTATRPRSSAAT